MDEIKIKHYEKSPKNVLYNQDHHIIFFAISSARPKINITSMYYSVRFFELIGKISNLVLVLMGFKGAILICCIAICRYIFQCGAK